MESTRIRLARTIHGDLDGLAGGLGRWLRADGSLSLGGLAEGQIRRLCRGVLRDFRAWLADADPVLIVRTRAALGCDRAAALAGTFLMEYLKTEGFYDPVPRAERGEMDALFESFFRAPPPTPLGASPGEAVAE